MLSIKKIKLRGVSIFLTMISCSSVTLISITNTAAATTTFAVPNGIGNGVETEVIKKYTDALGEVIGGIPYAGPGLKA